VDGEEAARPSGLRVTHRGLNAVREFSDPVSGLPTIPLAGDDGDDVDD
jgi:hypothetical protein